MFQAAIYYNIFSRNETKFIKVMFANPGLNYDIEREYLYSESLIYRIESEMLKIVGVKMSSDTPKKVIIMYKEGQLTLDDSNELRAWCNRIYNKQSKCNIDLFAKFTPQISKPNNTIPQTNVPKNTVVAPQTSAPKATVAASQASAPKNTTPVNLNLNGLCENQLLIVQTIFNYMKTSGININNQELCNYIVGYVLSFAPDKYGNCYDANRASSGICSLIKTGIIRDYSALKIFAPYIKLASINNTSEGGEYSTACTFDEVIETIKGRISSPNLWKVLNSITRNIEYSYMHSIMGLLSHEEFWSDIEAINGLDKYTYAVHGLHSTWERNQGFIEIVCEAFLGFDFGATNGTAYQYQNLSNFIKYHGERYYKMEMERKQKKLSSDINNMLR